jgi:hypothetical protein
MRQTHTFATLAVSASTFEEVERLLRAAGYGHVFIDDVIDMNGIGLVLEETCTPEAIAPGCPAKAAGLPAVGGLGDSTTPSPVRRPGHSRLRGRPRDEDGDIELRVEPAG